MSQQGKDSLRFARRVLAQASRAGLLLAMAEKTLFEKVCDQEVSADILYEDELCVAFRDIDPQAPEHILVVPRKPIRNAGLAEEADKELLGHLILVTQKVADLLGVRSADKGYRLVMNNWGDAGEAVPHLHIHLLAGRPMQWPPG